MSVHTLRIVRYCDARTRFEYEKYILFVYERESCSFRNNSSSQFLRALTHAYTPHLVARPEHARPEVNATMTRNRAGAGAAEERMQGAYDGAIRDRMRPPLGEGPVPSRATPTKHVDKEMIDG